MRFDSGRFIWVPLILIVISGCVERIEFSRVSDQLIVIEGMITDDPGPYTVKVSEGKELDASFEEAKPISNLSIELFDDLGNSEALVEASPGEYKTLGLLQGRLGGVYWIRVVAPNGNIYESTPEVLNPVGEVEEVRFEYEERVSTNDEFLEEVRADVFNIFFDSQAVENDTQSYTRWVYTGTYKVITNPELNFFWIQGNGLGMVQWPDPWPCSGHRFAWVGGPTIEQTDPCTCCTCWVYEYEDAPLLTDGTLVVDGQFKNIKAGEVPITSTTFYEKFRVEVAQMSMTKQAYDFFNLVRDQRLGADDLFQPIPSEINGNIKGVNNNDIVIGIFWATSVSKKEIYIDKQDVPYPLLPIPTVLDPCQEFYPNATNVQPEEWND